MSPVIFIIKYSIHEWCAGPIFTPNLLNFAWSSAYMVNPNKLPIFNILFACFTILVYWGTTNVLIQKYNSILRVLSIPCYSFNNQLYPVQIICCRLIFNLRKFDHVLQRVFQWDFVTIPYLFKINILVFLCRLITSQFLLYLYEKSDAGFRKIITFLNICSHKTVSRKITR